MASCSPTPLSNCVDQRSISRSRRHGRLHRGCPAQFVAALARRIEDRLAITVSIEWSDTELLARSPLISTSRAASRCSTGARQPSFSPDKPVTMLRGAPHRDYPVTAAPKSASHAIYRPYSTENPTGLGGSSTQRIKIRTRLGEGSVRVGCSLSGPGTTPLRRSKRSLTGSSRERGQQFGLTSGSISSSLARIE